jgi:SAM-dependent methyltransferase
VLSAWRSAGGARWLAGHGARRVLGIDPAARTLTLAAACLHARVRYCRASAETLTLAPGSLDVVVSSLAPHYVVGYDTLIRRIASWLRPGGHLVYSIEHPIHTARDPVSRCGSPSGGAGPGWVAR